MIKLEPVMQPAEFAERRKSYGLTQNEIALKIGVATVTVARWEQGHTMIPRWVRPWFKGMFGEEINPVWRAVVANWYGSPHLIRQVRGIFNTPEEALAGAVKESRTSERWHMEIPAAHIVMIERE